MRKGCGGASCDEVSLDGDGALVRDAAESHRLRPMIEWTLISWRDTRHVTTRRMQDHPYATITTNDDCRVVNQYTPQRIHLCI
jgi:hypothetical protein